MIELSLVNVFYNFTNSLYSKHIIKELEKLSDMNNYELLKFPENYNFDSYKNILKILELIKEKNQNKITKFIIITNSPDILIEFSNFMMLSFLKSDNVKLYLYENKIDSSLLVNVNNINVYQVENKRNQLDKLQTGYFGIKSNKLKNLLERSSKRYNNIKEIYDSYSSFNRDYYQLIKKTT